MKHRRLWIIAGVAVGLFVVLLLGVNIYLQSAATQKKLRALLSDAIGIPIHVGRISYLPWRGIVCTGIQLDPEVIHGKEAEYLRADALRVRFDLFSLFSRSIKIHSLKLEQPAIVLTQTKGGDFILPLPPVSTEPIPIEPAVAAHEDHEPSEPKAPRTVQVTSSSIKGGSILVRNEKGKTLVELNGINATSSLATMEHAKGTISIDSFRIYNMIELENLSTPFEYNNSSVNLPEITANLAGGKLAASFRNETLAEGRPYVAALKLSGVSVEKLIEQIGGISNKAEGTFEADIKLQGRIDDSSAANGNGTLKLSKGSFEPNEGLQAAGKLFKIRELEKLEIKKGHLNFHVDKGETFVDQFELGSDNLEVTAKGTIQSSGELNIQSELLVNKNLSRKLPDSTKENMHDVPGRKGYRALPFEITGTLKDPQSNFEDQLALDKFKSGLSDTVFQFLGGKKKKKED